MRNAAGGARPTGAQWRFLWTSDGDSLETDDFERIFFCRLNVRAIQVPALREGGEDPSAGRPFKKCWSRCPLPHISLSERALAILAAYNWPGNVRELENVIGRLAVLNKGKEIEPEHLPLEMRQAKNRVANLLVELAEGGTSLEDVEKEFLLRALDKYNGNRTHTAS